MGWQERSTASWIGEGVLPKNKTTRALATVVELKDLPQGPSLESDSDEAFVRWFMEWLQRFFHETQIVVDLGRRRGVQSGDYFVAIDSSKQLIGLKGEELGSLELEGSLMKVAQVDTAFSVCQLADYRYEQHFAALSSKLKALADPDGTIDLEKHVASLSPIAVGQRAVLVPHEESVWRDDLEDLYGRTLADGQTEQEKSFLFREMTRKADAFLLRHASGFFASRVLFQKGYAQFQMKDYRNAKDTFEAFLERFPFNVSASGAREWIGKAEQELAAEQDKQTAAAPIRILFLAANPKDTEPLRLGAELRSIDKALRMSDFGRRFELKQEWAVRIGDLHGALLRNKPHIVHFSGHGSDSNEIVLEDDAGQSRAVSKTALGDLFKLLKDNITCVVLNACYSHEQAGVIAKHIDCVVGMSDAIGNEAGIQFATAFYQALGYGRNMKEAFELGRNQIDLANLAEEDTPKLVALKGDPSAIRLVTAN
jgi:TolA-binding protein